MRSYICVILLLFLSIGCSNKTSKTFLFIGSYTGGEAAEGIYVYGFNTQTGNLIEVEREANVINPSFISLAPNGRNLYACTESKLGKNGSVSAFSIDTLTGKLQYLNRQDAGGRNPVHLVVDHNSKYAINSNFTDSGISIFKLNKDGSIDPYSQLIQFEGKSVTPKRQDASHLHSSNLSPDNKFVLSPDLGTDQIRVLSMSDEGQLTIIDSLTTETSDGSGPRHFTFHPNKRYAYCVDEISGTVSTYSYQNGKLNLIDQDFSYSQQLDRYSGADLHVSPDGKFLYCSNREKDENTIAIFSIDQSGFTLSLVGHQNTDGDHPRSFVIDPSGNFLLAANQNTGNVVVFKRNIETGLLTKTDVEIRIPNVSSLKMRSYGN